MSGTATTMQAPRTAPPAVLLPSQSVRPPSRYGPTKPPRLPTELTAASPAATPAPTRIEPGKLQNSDIDSRPPALATVMHATVSHVLSANAALSARAAPPSAAAPAACQRFSLRRSARRATSTARTAATKYDSAVTQPIDSIEPTPVCWMIDGNQKLMPYTPVTISR